LDWNTSFQIPQEKSISPEARDLLSKLLCNASERISFEELQAHPFFKSIDWQKIKSSDTPIIPRIESEIDVQNFEEFNEIFMTTLPDIQAYTNKIRNSDPLFAIALKSNII
jgi:serine/threonine kinase 38